MFPNSGSGAGPGGRDGLFRPFFIIRLMAVMETKETRSTARITRRWSTESAIIIRRRAQVDHPKNGTLLIRARGVAYHQLHLVYMSILHRIGSGEVDVMEPHARTRSAKYNQLQWAWKQTGNVHVLGTVKLTLYMFSVHCLQFEWCVMVSILPSTSINSQPTACVGVELPSDADIPTLRVILSRWC